MHLRAASSEQAMQEDNKTLTNRWWIVFLPYSKVLPITQKQTHGLNKKNKPWLTL